MSIQNGFLFLLMVSYLIACDGSEEQPSNGLVKDPIPSVQSNDCRLVKASSAESVWKELEESHQQQIKENCQNSESCFQTIATILIQLGFQPAEDLAWDLRRLGIQ